MFAGRRAAGFAVVTALSSAGGIFAVASCSSSDETPRSFDAAPPPPPGPCVVTRSTSTLCEGGAPAPGPADAGDGGGDAGAPTDGGITTGDAGGTLAPPPSENVCLVTADTSIACPLAVSGLTVATGKAEATDLVVSQRGVGRTSAQGFLDNDQNAYVQDVHLDGHGEGVVSVNPVQPFLVASPPAQEITIVGGSPASDPALVVWTPKDGGGITLKAGHLVAGTPVTFGPGVDVSGAGGFRSTFFTAALGESLAMLEPRDPATNALVPGPILLARGLPDATRVTPTTIAPESAGTGFLVRIDPKGTPVGLFYDSSPPALKLRAGDDFGAVRWSYPLTAGAVVSSFDLAYVNDVPAVLLRDVLETQTTSVHFIRSPDAKPPGALLGSSFSTCSRATYIGITCDACPVTQQCQTGEDQITAARLFVDRGRLFAIYLSTDVRRTMGYELDTTPIIGIGCVCSLVTRKSEAFADSLVLVEIVPPADPAQVPTVVEHMRLPLFAAHASALFALSPRPDGDVDVVFGPQVSGNYTAVLTEYPKTPTQYRALRISTKALP